MDEYNNASADWSVYAKDGYGDLLSGYPTTTTIPVHFRDEQETIRTPKGEEVMSDGFILLPTAKLPSGYTIDDRISVNGREYGVLCFKSREGFNQFVTEVRLR